MPTLSEKARQARLKYMKEYRDNNKERIQGHKNKWQRNNRDKTREYQRRYWERIAVEQEQQEEQEAKGGK